MKPQNVTCPKCDGPMVSRVNSQSGQRFWGCKAYPDCKGTRNTDGEARSEYEPRLPFDKDAEPADLPSQRPARLGPRWRQ